MWTNAIRAAVAGVIGCAAALPQAETPRIREALEARILPREVSAYQLRQYLLKRIAPPPAPRSAAEWTTEAGRLRRQLLEVVFHGWPKEWVDAAPKFEEVGVLQGRGYRIRKLRYEIVPGFYSTALLYEPDTLAAKMPAILNVNGHVGEPGKAVEYKQKRCITMARAGALALSLEWLDCGELSGKENHHFNGGLLDLAGTNEVGLFYLAMRKGLDYLYEHPNVERSRIGMTGLSGGGWQTITLTSLDERIRAAVPVAGFSSAATRIEVNEFGDTGDVEQNATDFFTSVDYTHLVGLVAPRPMLLAYNAEDDCCFRGPAARPLIFDAMRPVFGLYGNQDLLSYHENRDPGTHNYQLDNRMQAYRFFARHLGLRPIEDEGDAASEVRTFDDLRVGLPAGNLTIVGLARKLAGGIERPAASATLEARKNERAQLASTLRYRPATLDRASVTGISKHLGVESWAYLFSMADGLSATGVWLQAIGASPSAPVTLVLNDKGKAAAEPQVTARINQGERVLALDVGFTGAAWDGKTEDWAYQQMLYATGDRPLGIEAAQLIAIARWAAKRAGVGRIRVETNGIRTEVIAVAASALEPEIFTEVVAHGGMRSLQYVFRKPVTYEEAPDLFCLDLFKVTDIDRLAALAAPAKVTYLAPVD